MEPRTCIACEGSRFTLLPTSTAGVHLLRCDSCGCSLTHPRPDSAELESSYSQAYYGPENRKFIGPVEKIVGWVTGLRASKIHHRLPPHGKVLEVGCGRGWLLKSLAKLGHECHGTERSELAAQGARRIVGVKIYSKQVEECGFAKDQFDMVILWHVLEHLDDPGGSLAVLNSLLKPGGLLLVEVPNYSSLQARLAGRHWFHLDLEHHLQHFSAKSLLQLLRRSGFQVDKISTFNVEQGPYGALQSGLNMLGLQGEQLYKILKREIIPPVRTRVLSYLAAAALAMPALCFSLFEASLKRGGVLRVVARKTPRN